MGSKTTKLFKSSAQPDHKAQDQNDAPHYEQPKNYNNPQPEEPKTKNPVGPFIHYRRGSMYIDEDGDIAHEFYVETKEGSKLTLKRISNKHLTPQGDVPLDVPCIRNDYPIVLWDQNKIKE